MSKLVFITHPEVIVDPATDIRRWRLSETGTARMKAFAQSPILAGISRIWTSTETKAVEAATILAARSGVAVRSDPNLGENDRSSTGYLPRDEFEAMADAFFSQPEKSVRGWERAIDAQTRIRAAVTRITANHTRGDIAIVSHGAVGTLLLCSLLEAPISRTADQPFQGHYWQALLPGPRVLHTWRAIAP